MQISDKIHRYILNNKEKILKDYIDLLKIPSISDTQGAIDVLHFVKGLYTKNGFEPELYDNYLLAHYKKGEKSIGLFSHADVVPVDDKWTKASPFEPKIIDGNLFARGSVDDKSAIIISLYALKAIKELNIPFNSSLICFTGNSEESTMSDIKSYLKSHTPPDFSLVLDAAFPVYYGDKGMLWLSATLDNGKLEELIDINGGTAYNIILGEASAKVRYSQALYNDLSRNSELKISREQDEISIYAKGISSHGAMPKGSKNAGGIILSALQNAPSFSQGDKEKLKLLTTLLTTFDGDAIGIKAADNIFGETTVTNGIIKVENGKLKFTLDIRHGNSYTQDELTKYLKKTLSSEKISFEIVKDGDAHHADINSSYIKACMRAYREHTGDTNAMPRINAGGTYQRYLPSSCETGTTTKYLDCGLPQGHGGAHQPNEHISIDGFFEAMEIVIKMLIECDKQN